MTGRSPRCDIRSVVPKAKRSETVLACSQPIDVLSTPRFEDAMLRASQPDMGLETATVLASFGAVRTIGSQRSTKSRYARWPQEHPLTPRRTVGNRASHPGQDHPSPSSLPGESLPPAPWARPRCRCCVPRPRLLRPRLISPA